MHIHVYMYIIYMVYVCSLYTNTLYMALVVKTIEDTHSKWKFSYMQYVSMCGMMLEVGGNVSIKHEHVLIYMHHLKINLIPLSHAIHIYNHYCNVSIIKYTSEIPCGRGNCKEMALFRSNLAMSS